MGPGMSEFYWFKSKTISTLFAGIIAEPVCAKTGQTFNILKLLNIKTDFGNNKENYRGQTE